MVERYRYTTPAGHETVLQLDEADAAARGLTEADLFTEGPRTTRARSARYELTPAYGAIAALERGVRSVCLAIIGDSTGTDTDEWFGIMGQLVGRDWPGYATWHRPWNDTTQEYDPPEVLRAGTANGSTERRAALGTAGAMSYSGTAGAGDHDVRARLLPDDGWAPGGAASVRVILSRYNAAGSSRGWLFYLDEAGKLCWTWSAAGSADTGTVKSTAAVPFAAGTPGCVRVVFDVDNGAAGSTDRKSVV